MKTYDLSGVKVIALSDVEDAVKNGADTLAVAANAIFTPSARDLINSRNISLSGGAAASVPAASHAAFDSPEAQALKAEICNVGRKLWARMYVDGNGGNISCRLGPDTVLCTPTLISKADLTPADLCLVDMQGNQLAGGRPRTSEVLMHLEIYKAVPEAKAVVHCHPPHATAYAITGRVPITCVIPEYEVFIGKVAITPYETPGTQRFAETVIPHVRDHNAVLLGNHGIVCWADTVTHAEWYAEVLDTYCWTLMLASQLGPISQIPCDKAEALLAIKQRLGLPDPRFSGDPKCQVCDVARGGEIAIPPCACSSNAVCSSTGAVCTKSAKPDLDTQAIVQAVTESVLKALGK